MLSVKNKDLRLKGNYMNKRECHIIPNWLLIYRIENKRLGIFYFFLFEATVEFEENHDIL